MKKGKILSVDDDEGLQIVISQYLEEEGYQIFAAQSAQTALEKIDGVDLDVILLDLTLPDGEGLTLIPQFKNKIDAAIIIVSGKSDTTEKIVCLEMGADDYLTKPFEMRELAARIKAVMRRSSDIKVIPETTTHKDKDIIFFDNGWFLDRSQYQLFTDNKASADLTTGEFQLLEALVLSSNRVLSRERLFELTRGSEYDVFDRAIDIQIARLRKKIGDDTKSPTLIKTVRGVGYMFTGSLKY